MSFTDGIDGYCSAFEEFMNKDTIQDLRREIDEMTCLVNGFRSENDRLKEENAKLYLSNKELKRENKQLEKININLDNEISELEKEQDNLKQEYKIAIDENNFFIKENARLEEEVEKRGYTILSAENKCLKEINSNLKVEIERLKDQCHKLGKDYSALTKETAFFEEEIKNLKRDNGILTRQIFINKYDHAITKARELKNERLKFEEEIKKLKEENKDLDKRLKDVEADWAATECEKMQLEEAFDNISKQNVDLINALKNRAETKIYQLSAEDFAKTFKGQWTISISPDEVSTSDFTVNNENDKDRLSYYLTYKDTEYDEPFDKIYKYLESYQIERVAIAKMLDEIRAEIKSSEFVVKQFEDMMLNDEE
jgi:chromosome segregation ATPase